MTMSRRHWSAIRRVAEEIAWGGRDLWNLKKIPDLTVQQASAAVDELNKRGLISVCGTRVDPTELFNEWLRGVREREDTAVRETDNPPIPTVSPRQSVERASAPSAPEDVGGPCRGDAEDRVPQPRRSYRQRIPRPDLQGSPQLLWMWRWANALNELGGRAYLRDLRRRLNSHKHKSDSEAGLNRLISFRYVRRSKEGRRPVLELVRFPEELDPPKPKRRHPRRSRGRTDWFELLLDYR